MSRSSLQVRLAKSSIHLLKSINLTQPFYQPLVRLSSEHYMPSTHLIVFKQTLADLSYLDSNKDPFAFYGSW